MSLARSEPPDGEADLGASAEKADIKCLPAEVYENSPTAYTSMQEDGTVPILPRLLGIAEAPAAVSNRGGIQTPTLEIVILDTQRIQQPLSETMVLSRNRLPEMIQSRVPELRKEP